VEDFRNPYISHDFTWAISEVLTALLDAGLVLTAFREYPYMNGARFFENMRALPGGRLALPEGEPDLPLMYGLAARKPDRS
jgi:hypothetical protein